MLDWDTVIPTDLRCPILWVIGLENQGTVDSFKKYEEELPRSKVQVRLFEGLNHEQEFNKIDQILPVILNFVRS